MHDNELANLAIFEKNTRPRPYINAVVRRHHPFKMAARLDAAKKAGWNVFQFPSEMLEGGDLLSDSGTTSISAEQLAALVLGDSAYGSNWGYFKLLETFEKVFGQNIRKWEVYLFHQCRAAEHALFTQLALLEKKRNKAKKTSPTLVANAFFDTTRANIEANDMIAIDLPANTEESEGGNFKGNISLSTLSNFFSSRDSRDIPIVYVTITNNTDGGQPVSLANMHAARNIAHENNTPFFLDACRFAENAWFIKMKEEGQSNRPIENIVHEMFALCDGFTISFKKDGLSNMGGALFLKNDSFFLDQYGELPEMIRDHQILTEGHPTYGGISGRDIMVIARGLLEVTEESYLDYRISQVKRFGEHFVDFGIPVLTPFGGHAVYIDTSKFFEDTEMKQEDFGGISLTALLLLNGVRLCELGAFAFGKYDPVSKQDSFPAHDYVRAAVPRNKYEAPDLLYVAECVKNLYEHRQSIPRAVVTSGREKRLRHFKAQFELKPIS